MSTVAEIEEAIKRLAVAEREELEARLFASRFGLSRDAGLMASLDEAEKEIDEGRGFSPDQLRESVRRWAGK